MVKLVAHELNILVNRYFIGVLPHESQGKVTIKRAQEETLD